MSIVDIVCLTVFVLCILSGIYRGSFHAALRFGVTILSILLARVMMIPVASAVKGDAELYNMLLYYTEGSEYVAKSSIELTRTSIHSVGVEDLRTIINNAEMPLPMGSRVLKNVAAEVFADTGYTALGDYFNLTIVAVVINLCAMLLCFILIRLLLGFVLRTVEYGRGGFPLLSQFDTPVAAGIGFLEGVLLLFVVFLMLPVALTVLPNLAVYVRRSFFGEFFYRANVLYWLIPGT